MREFVQFGSRFFLTLILFTELCVFAHTTGSDRTNGIGDMENLRYVLTSKPSHNLPVRASKLFNSLDERQAQVGIINWTDNIPKALEVFGLGLLYLRTLSIGTGLQLLSPLGILPALVISLIVLFLPAGLIPLPSI